jgi:dienelactone hydrolase
MDLLSSERGARRFVLVGLCSGAILAQQFAANDPRIAGAVLIDGSATMPRAPCGGGRGLARSAGLFARESSARGPQQPTWKINS